MCYSRDYRIEVSNNKEEWKTIKSRINPEDDGERKTTPTGNPVIVKETQIGRKARYVRCYIEQNSALYKEFSSFVTPRIMEAKVFPKKVPGTLKLYAQILN